MLVRLDFAFMYNTRWAETKVLDKERGQYLIC